MKTILIAPNSFKNCINSDDAADTIKRYLFKNNPHFISKFNILKRPISDGGDGFLKICDYYYNLKIRNYTVKYLDDKYHNVPVGIDITNRTAYIETAKLLGYNSISDVKKHGLNPYTYSSLPLGQLLFQINEDNKKYNQIDKVVIGIGGTITSDLGLGMMLIFGLKLKRGNLCVIPKPSKYMYADTIEYKKPILSYNIEFVTDVTNMLLGETGANYCFGEQKGIKRKHLQIFEIGFKNIIRLLKIKDVDNYSGAGGGVAFGLQFFFDAKKITASEFILERLELKNINPDYIITGEGSFDKQSLLNKGTKILIDYGLKKRSKKIFVISGKHSMVKDESFIIYNMQDYFKSIEESKKFVKKGFKVIIDKISTEIIKEYNGK